MYKLYIWYYIDSADTDDSNEMFETFPKEIVEIFYICLLINIYIWLFVVEYQLIKENNELKQVHAIKTEQINALQLVHQHDLKEHTQALSEKSALVENMRSQIEKLESGQKVKLLLHFPGRLVNL